MDEKPNSNHLQPDEADKPIGVLANLDVAVPDGFWTRVRKKIDRRVATGHLLSFSWILPKVILAEFLGMAFSAFSSAKSRKGESR